MAGSLHFKRKAMNSILFLTLMVCAAGLVTAIIVYFDRDTDTDNNSGMMDSAEIIKALRDK